MTGSNILEIQLWTEKLDELRQKQRFSPDPARDERELRNLKREVQREWLRCIEGCGKAKKLFWACILAAVVGAISGALLSGGDGVPGFCLFLIAAGIVAAVIVKKAWANGLDEKLLVIADFDKQNFDGEVHFAVRNGREL